MLVVAATGLAGCTTSSELRGFTRGDRIIAYLSQQDDFVFVPHAWSALTPFEGILTYSDAAWRSSAPQPPTSSDSPQG